MERWARLMDGGYIFKSGETVDSNVYQVGTWIEYEHVKNQLQS